MKEPQWVCPWKVKGQIVSRKEEISVLAPTSVVTHQRPAGTTIYSNVACRIDQLTGAALNTWRTRLSACTHIVWRYPLSDVAVDDRLIDGSTNYDVKETQIFKAGNVFRYSLLVLNEA